jgi:hypothetical protein
MRKQTADRISTSAYRAFLAAGTCLPLVRRGRRSGDQLYCAVETLGLGLLAVKTLKALVPERRPDTGRPNSFPSSHATLAVSTAVVAGDIDRERAPRWYAGALVICASRVLLNRHRPVDVAAGALLGWGLARRILATEFGGCETGQRALTNPDVIRPRPARSGGGGGAPAEAGGPSRHRP